MVNLDRKLKLSDIRLEGTEGISVDVTPPGTPADKVEAIPFTIEGIQPVLETPRGVEASMRYTEHGPVLYLLNHSQGAEEITLTVGKRYRDLLQNKDVDKAITLAASEVAILVESS